MHRSKAMTEHFPGGSLKTVAKLIILEEYLDIYTDILGGGTWKSGLWYIDTHAGTGMTKIDESGRLVDGSAVRAIGQYQDDFDRFYLYEVETSHFELLHKTLARRFDIDFEVRPTKIPDEDFMVARSKDPEVIIMQMDSNNGVQKLVEFEQKGSHWFTFIDPKGLTARKDTIDALRKRGNIDILINYQTT